MVILRERRKAARLVVSLVVPPHQVWSPTSTTTTTIVMIKAMKKRVCGDDANSGEGGDEHTPSLLMTIMRTDNEAQIYTSTF